LVDASKSVVGLDAKQAAVKATTAGLDLRQAQAVELAQVRERLKLTEELSRYEQQAQKMRSERDSAKLSGQVEAMQAQGSELMRALSGR